MPIVRPKKRKRRRSVRRRIQPARRFQVVVADPPWPFKDKLPGDGRGAQKHYRLMSMDDIKAYPVSVMVEDDALLFLWRVPAMGAEAYDVCRAWGFQPKSELVWRKTSRIPA